MEKTKKPFGENWFLRVEMLVAYGLVLREGHFRAKEAGTAFSQEDLNEESMACGFQL